MNKFALDYDQLEKTLTKKKSYLLADVVDRIEKVAFDTVRFRDNEDTEMLWKIQDSPDGPIIVALYDEETGALKVEGSDWTTVKQANNIHVFYKDEPVTVLKGQNIGIPEDEMGLAARWIPKKLASDEEFQAYTLSLAANIQSFKENYPELQKVASRAQAIKNGVAFRQRKDLSEIAELITRD